MRLDRVDLNLFVVFDAIYTERNLTRTAEVLHVTQPAISNALRRLRETFNDQLFVRTPDGMVPTPVAENVIGHVRQALQLLGTSLNEHHSFEPATSDRTLQVSMGDLAEAIYLPSLVQKLQIMAPNISLLSFFLPRQEVAMELANNGIDLAVEPPLLTDTQLLSHPLVKEKYVCVLRKDHPYGKQPLTMERYLELSHLHLSSRRRGIGQVDLALKGLGEKRHIALRAQHYMVAPLVIASTDLALSVPAVVAAQMGLQVLPLPFEVPPLELHLFWHKNSDNDSANQWLRQVFTNLSTPAVT